MEVASVLVIVVGRVVVDAFMLLLMVVVCARDAENWSWLSSLSRLGLKSPDGSVRPPSGSTGGFSTSVILFSHKGDGCGARGGQERTGGVQREEVHKQIA